MSVLSWTAGRDGRSGRAGERREERLGGGGSKKGKETRERLWDIGNRAACQAVPKMN